MDDFHCLRLFTISKGRFEPVPMPSFSVASRKLRKQICQWEQCSILGNVHIGRWSGDCYLSVESHLGLFTFKFPI